MAYMCKGFSHFSGFFAWFCIGQISHGSSIRVRMYAKWHAAAAAAGSAVAARARAVAGWVAVRERERERCAFQQHTQGRRPEYCGGGRDED